LSALSLIHKETKEWFASVVQWEHPDAKDVLHGLAWLWDIIKVDPLRLGKHYICFSFELLALILIDLYEYFRYATKKIRVGIDWFRWIVFLSEPKKKMEVN
jgi:hypothetical protein